MPTTQIVNPSGAFGAPVTGATPNLDGLTYIVLVAAANINAGQTVAINTANQAVVGTAVQNVVGVSLDTVLTGQQVRVAVNGVVRGVCIAPVGGVTAGTVYAAGAAGAFAAASATIGLNIVVALTTAAAGLPFDAIVCKM